MRATSKLLRFIAAIACVAVVAPEGPSHVAAAQDVTQKLDRALKDRSTKNRGGSRVIINTGSATSGKAIDYLIRSVGGKVGKRLAGGSSLAAIVPNDALPEIAASPLVERVSLDRVVVATMDRTAETVGAVSARQTFGVDGTGIGVAVIDSGIIGWHDDLADGRGGQRVVDYVDFSSDAVDFPGGVAGDSTVPEDGFGHGTHVAGIIAGNGADSGGGITGIAPRAQLIVLKVLDAAGRGHTSDVIAAIDYAVSRRAAFNIRVINLSIAAPIYESYTVDPLTLAAERAVRAGITVVAAAGNNGRSRDGRVQYGGITAPGNAPWVLTVGASSHMGTAARADDTIPPFASRGPTAFDQAAKPDIVAPGVGIESLAAPGSSLYETGTAYLVRGTVPTGPMPYMSLSGLSMSAAVVSGTTALMMQANPQLTPNAVKAILQYTAQVYAGYDALTEGAGFLNAKGAIALARQFVTRSTKLPADATRWSGAVTWGNRLVKGGLVTASANAWPSGVRWGADRTDKGLRIELGVRCESTNCSTTSTKWGVDTGSVYNVVWGAACRGADCNVPWSLDLVRASADGETVVWGTTDGETVVWGTIDGETVVWGTADGETVVWGTGCSDPSCAIIWGRP